MQHPYAQRQKPLRGPLMRREVLDMPIAQSVQAANSAYVEELLVCAQQTGELGGLSPAVLAALGGLSRIERRRLAGLPFTLFSLRFADADYWRDMIERPSAAGRGPAAGEGFARTAIFLAWHLVQAGPTTAGVALGMSQEVATLYQWLPLSDLDRLAGLAHPAIAPRWPWHSGFWESLISAARHASALEGARFYGLQLLAAETLPDTRTSFGV